MQVVGEHQFRIYRPSEYGSFPDRWVVTMAGEYESTLIAVDRDQGRVVHQMRQFVREAQQALGTLRSEIADAQPVPER